MGNGLSRRGALGGMLGAGLIVAVSTGGPVEAATATAPRQPLVHTRREWRARAPKGAVRVLPSRPDHIVVHHTQTANSADYSLAHALELSRRIQRFHMGNRGWTDIGEQLTISRGGHIVEGRSGSLRAIQTGRHVVGAQTLHHNEHTIGIENEGAYMKASPPEALWSSLVEVCAWLCTAYGLDPARAIVGHRDYVATSCPGNVLYALLPQLRREAAAALGAAGPDDVEIPDGIEEDMWPDQDPIAPQPARSPATGPEGSAESGEQRPGEGDPQDSGPV